MRCPHLPVGPTCPAGAQSVSCDQELAGRQPARCGLPRLVRELIKPHRWPRANQALRDRRVGCIDHAGNRLPFIVVGTRPGPATGRPAPHPPMLTLAHRLRTTWARTHSACQIPRTVGANRFCARCLLGACVVSCCPRHCLRAVTDTCGREAGYRRSKRGTHGATQAQTRQEHRRYVHYPCLLCQPTLVPPRGLYCWWDTLRECVHNVRLFRAALLESLGTCLRPFGACEVGGAAHWCWVCLGQGETGAHTSTQHSWRSDIGPNCHLISAWPPFKGHPSCYPAPRALVLFCGRPPERRAPPQGQNISQTSG